MTKKELKTVCDAITILMMVQRNKKETRQKVQIPSKYVDNCLEELCTMFEKYEK